MQIAVFSTRSYDREFLDPANERCGHELLYLEERLNARTASLASGAGAVCAFVNDQVDAEVLAELARQGARLVTLRSAGFNNVDIHAARQMGITVAHVPAYSPHAVAEHTLALILSLNRKLHRAYARVREGNFSLDGLLGFDLHGRTVGIVGTGLIGTTVARILHGIGCKLLAYDPVPQQTCQTLGVRYVALESLLAESDIVTLHCPLTPETRHLINSESLRRVRPGVMLINTGRGALVDTRAAIAALKDGRIGALGLDVYEEETNLFFQDLSRDIIHDDVFARLLTFPNVLVTAHQGYFTSDALKKIAGTTLENVTAFEKTGRPVHEVLLPRVS